VFTKAAASLGLKPAYRPNAPKPVVGLPTQIANDKGRYRQLRAQSQSPELFQPEPPPNIPNLGSSARLSRVGTEFDPPQEGDFAIVDVNVLYHSRLSWQASNKFLSRFCGIVKRAHS
jgi:hypothetical protein